MSHFSVLVVGNVESQMEPFQENNMENCPKEYLEFHDVEENAKEEFESGFTTRFKDSSGNLHSRYDLKGENIEEFEKIEIPFKEHYANFAEFVEEYLRGYSKDPENGRYGYWENPNAKWDWYSVGGRWAGSLQLTKEAQLQIEQGLIPASAMPNFSYGFSKEEKEEILKKALVDSALKKNIDIPEMERPRAERARKIWKEWNSKIKFLWSENKERDNWLLRNMGLFFSKEDLKRLNTMSLDEYVECRSIWSPYAVAWDGRWYSRGEMGWFGVSFVNEESWSGQFRELWKEIPEDATLTIVDCHI